MHRSCSLQLLQRGSNGISAELLKSHGALVSMLQTIYAIVEMKVVFLKKQEHHVYYSIPKNVEKEITRSTRNLFFSVTGKFFLTVIKLVTSCGHQA